MRAARLDLTRRAGPITLQNKPMKKSICTTLLSAGLVLTGLSTKAQGLEGVIVEEFHTITQADADLLNNDLGNSSFPIVAGSKVYRVYVDMAPNYRFLQVYSTNAGNAADFSTTTTFWNDDNFGSEFPAQTRRASTGTLFDSYITLGSTGTAGGASPCGALGSNAAQVGVPRTADTNGDLTSCGVFPGFSGNDGSIPGVVPALTTNLSGALDFTALTGSGNTFTWIDDAYATLPAGTGVDPAGTNRILIGQFTTDGAFSFHLNVDISDPNNVIESYFWANPVAGGSVSPFLTYPSACNAPVLSAPTSNGPICAGQALNLNASATGDATITYSWSGPNSFSSIAQNPTIAAATVAASGTYTVTASNGCAPNAVASVNVLVNPSTNNTTTISACDSYTWTVNGTTYTQSGTYTSVNGCGTETLVLTITPSTNNTTTVSECDSYTWAVNGTTYTASGTYTNVVGCATETLVLTITPSTNNTTTETACATYTWAVNGTTYTQSGTYTSVNGCATETLILTVTIPGTACNDGNNGTINDTYDQNCNCVGVPTGCTENIILNITLDAFGSQTSWSLLQDGTATVVEAGGPYNDGMMGAVIIEELCVPAGCYRLVVNDAAGDGIVGGGYELLVSGTNARIIDNKANFSTGSVSAISGNQAFCLPLSNDGLLASSCDKLDWVNGQYMVAAPNAAVSAQWLVGNQSDDGYEFWIFDPNGSYSFRRFRNHANSDGFGPASATRACHMKVNNWAVSSQIPANVLMNVRVRARVNGLNGAFGPACRMVINPVLAACPQTQLMNVPGASTFSCGVTRPFAPGSYIYARPVSGANRYQFRFSQPNEGVVAVRTSTNYILQLNWVTGALLAGETYDVEVRVSKNNGATWCTDAAVWGPVCQVTIGAPGAVLGGANFAGIADAAELRMFPNPNRGDVLNFSLSAIEEGVNTVSMDIFDLSGKRVSARTIAVADGNVNTVIDLNGELAAGMYLVNFTAGANVYTERLMIQP